MADYPADVDALLAAMHERNKKAFRLMRDLKCEAIIAYEDTSTTLLNEEWLLNYAVTAVNDYAEILKDSGKVYVTHMCGKLNAFKHLISRFKSDGIDSLCPPTTGDLCLWDARKAFPEKVLIGGIEPPALVVMNKEETLRYIIDFINNMTDKTGVILSTGDATPNGTKIENLKAVADLIKYLGKNSLSSGLDYSVIENI